MSPKLNNAVISTIEEGEIYFKNYSDKDISHTCRPTAGVRNEGWFLRHPPLTIPKIFTSRCSKFYRNPTQLPLNEGS